MEQLLVEDWGLPFRVDDLGVYKPMMEATSKDGNLYIEGIFLQANIVNRNGRLYPKGVLATAVDKYIKEQVNTFQALGELNHPSRSNVDPEHAAIRITEMRWDGDNVIGKALVLNTPKGQIVKGLIEGGWIPGVSSRGLGSVKLNGGINEVQEGFRLTVGVDVVWGPSAPSAYVRPVTESTDDNKAFINLTEQLERFL